MNTGNWMRLASHSRTVRMAGVAAALLVALLVTACGAGNPAIGGQTPRPTATVPAESQDVVSPPSTVPTPVATTTLPPLTATKVHKPLPTGIPAAPSAAGKVILVSLSRQQLYAYDNGEFAFTILVETGRPELATPTGLYHVFYKSCSDQRWLSNTAPTSAHNANCTEHNGDGFQETFRSPWPEGSPYWYAPTHINYALKFRDDGFYLHDAWWHVAFGPGSNVPTNCRTAHGRRGRMAASACQHPPPKSSMPGHPSARPSISAGASSVSPVSLLRDNPPET